MKFRILAGALALALSFGTAAAQPNPGTSPYPISKGGTGGSTASAARANLGLTIGSAVQAWDADLDALAALSGTNTIYYRSGVATWSAVTIGGLLSFSAGTLNVGDAELVALAGLTSAADKCAYFTGSGTAALTDCPSFGRSLMNAASASAARGTLGLAIGSDVQAYSANLAVLAGLTMAVDKITYWTGAGAAANTDFTSLARTLNANTTASGMRSTLGVVIGTDVQAYDAELAALAGLTSAADKCIYFTGSATAALADCPSYGRSLFAAASASAARTTLGLVIGTDVQAQDAELAALAGLTSAADKCAYFTGSGTAALMDCGSALRSFFTTSSSANLRSLITDETGTGPAMFGTAPTVDGLFNISGAVKFSTQSAPSQITSNQNDYNPSSVVCATSATLLINSDAARDITGLAGGVAGCIMRLVNNGSFTITFKEENASSSAANRFKTGGDIALASNAGVTLIYEGGSTNRWRAAAPLSAGGGSGTVTQVVCGTGLSGGTITTSGTCALDINSLTADSTPDRSADYVATYDASATTSKKVLLNKINSGFRANKNASDQTSITGGTETKATFTNEVFDQGSYYDAANSKWTPPAGLVTLTCSIYMGGTFTTGTHYESVMIWKNGAVLSDVFQYSPNASLQQVIVTTIDSANGTDYYECYGNHTVASGTVTFKGDVRYSYFAGSTL